MAIGSLPPLVLQLLPRWCWIHRLSRWFLVCDTRIGSCVTVEVRVLEASCVKPLAAAMWWWCVAWGPSWHEQPWKGISQQEDLSTHSNGASWSH